MHDVLRQRRRRRAKAELARFKAARARGGPPPDPSFYDVWAAASLRSGGDPKDPYAEHPGVFRAVSVIAQDMGGVPLRLYTGPTEADKREMLTGPWYDLLSNPHPDQDAAIVWALTRTWYLLDGEAFWLLRNRDGSFVEPRVVPAAVDPVRGSTMTEIVHGSTGALVGWEWDSGRAKVRLRLDQVVQFRCFANASNPRRGLAPLSPVRRSIRTDSKAHTWNEASLDNGAEPGVVLEQDKDAGFLTDEQQQQLRQQWVDLHGGPGNARKPAVLPGGMKVSTLGWSPKDMEYAEQRKWSRFEIASAYGVPLMLMGDMSEVHSKESARVVLKVYWENTVRPHLLAEQRVLDRQLFLGRGDGDTASQQRVWAVPDLSGVSALQTEETERRANAEADRRLGFPLNEINRRHELGYEDQEAGDVGLVAGGLVPVTAVGYQFPDEPEGPSEEEPDDDADEPPGDLEDDEDDRGCEVLPKITTRGGSSTSPEQRAILWHQYIRGIQRPGEQRMRTAVLAWMRDIRREALRFVERAGRGAKSARSMTEAEIVLWLAGRQKAWDEAIVAKTAPVTEWTVKVSLQRLAAQVGAAMPNMTSPEMLQFLNRMGARKVTLVSATVKQTLRAELLEGAGLGESIADLQARVKAVMNASASRSLTIARTETGAASTGSRFESARAMGVKKISWLSARDEVVRDSHQIDGETVEYGQPFSNGLLYPLDQGGPAGECVNCRCDWIAEREGLSIL